MRLSKAQIREFRSIESLDISFDHGCLVLLGINESGKTNILDALALLSPERKVKAEDIRQAPHHHAPPEESYVRFVFRTTDDSQKALLDAVQNSLFDNGESIQIRLGAAEQDLATFLRTHLSELLLHIDVQDGSRRPTRWKLPSDFELVGSWFVPGDNFPPEQKVRIPGGNPVVPRNYALLRLPEGAPDPRLRPAVAADFERVIGGAVGTVVTAGLPECISWSHENNAVLPPAVDFAAFLDNPSQFPVVRNMFDLAGIDSISEEVQLARRRTTGLRSLLERVAAKATEHIRGAWDGFRALSIELHENGKRLECLIRDVHEPYAFHQRSDGFRRLVSFLLMVSARYSSGGLRNTVLLYDEPDTSLHPSGVRQLRDELLRLSEANQVVFSTHSIFMVDPDNLERHLIVERRDEVTRARIAKAGIVADEEVLYNAVGHSVFSILRKYNLLLEGYRDRVLLETALRSSSEECRTFFEQVGRCHTGGVKNVPKVAPVLELANRHCLIVTDSDKPALESRKTYEGYGSWKTYGELAGDRFVTAEDFVRWSRLEHAVATVSATVPELNGLAGALNEAKPFMSQVEHWLQRPPGLTKERRREVSDALKTAVFDSIEPDHLRGEASILVAAIRERIEADVSGAGGRS